MAYTLGIDLGTGSLKGLLFNHNGVLVGEASRDYDLYTPKAGYSEQNPLDWKEASDQVIKELISKYPEMRKELIGISFSGQMHSLVLLDKENNIIRPAILWNDVRTTKQCENIMSEFNKEIIEVTRNVALEGFTLPKILWVQENEPENWDRVEHLMLPKDYLVFHMTGKYSMDFSDAAGTLLLDIKNKKWSKRVLEKYGISINTLPRLYGSYEEVALLREELISEYGFEQEVKVFAGGADNACAALASGIVKDEVGMVSIGTSGVFLSFESNSESNYDGKLHVFNHVVKDEIYSMGVTLAAGNSLTWYRNTFFPTEDFSELLEGIDTITPGSNGLIFTPYISGERTPHPDSQIRGSFIGLDIQHQKKHFSRAVLEGITFSLKDSQQIMKAYSNKKHKKLVSVGGGAKNEDWLQIQADIFDATILTLKTEQGPGMGAAMLAAIGCGLFTDIESCVNAFVKYDKEIKPIEKNVIKYKEIYDIYTKVYSQTADICHELMEL